MSTRQHQLSTARRQADAWLSIGSLKAVAQFRFTGLVNRMGQALSSGHRYRPVVIRTGRETGSATGRLTAGHPDIAAITAMSAARPTA